MFSAALEPRRESFEFNSHLSHYRVAGYVFKFLMSVASLTAMATSSRITGGVALIVGFQRGHRFGRALVSWLTLLAICKIGNARASQTGEQQDFPGGEARLFLHGITYFVGMHVRPLSNYMQLVLYKLTHLIFMRTSPTDM